MTAASVTRPLYRPLDGLMVRAPLLPACAFAASGAELDRWCADPEFVFALAVASADMTVALDGPAGAAPAARAAAQRYLIRAATRPTPFGGFAAIGLARWAGRTDLAVAAGRRPTRTRPDLAWLTDLTLRLAADPVLRPRLRVYANSCVLERDGRYYLTDPGTGGTRSGPDISVRATSVVRRVLSLARSPIAWEELGRLVAAPHPDVDRERVEAVLDRLAEQQFLLPEVLPALTADPLAGVRKAIAQAGEPGGAGAADGWCARLGQIAGACREVDDADLPVAVRQLATLRRRLSAIDVGRGPGTQADGARPPGDLQVDSALPLSGTGVTRTVAADVTAAVDLLFRLHPDPLADPLAGYRAAFHARYGDRRVALLEVLDPRFGLGPPDGHHGTSGHYGGAGHYDESPERAETLCALAASAIRDGRDEVELDDGLVGRLSAWTPDPARLPASVELSVFLAASSRAALDRGEYLLMVGPNLGAQAAGRGLGRFADLLGVPAREFISSAADAEQAVYGARTSERPLVAELVYRPLRARAANVAVRPVVRGYELPVGVAPSLPPERVVRVDELSLALHDGRFRLYWDRLDRPVLPAAGHMLNPAAAPPLCRSLLELAGDGTTWLSSFDWGPAAGLPFLPRVRRGRVVLSPA